MNEIPDPGQAAAAPPVAWEVPAGAAPSVAPGDLRMSSGDIFQRAIELYRRGFVILAVVAAVVQIPLAAVGYLLGTRVADAIAPLAALGENPSQTDVQAALQRAFSEAGPSLGTIGLVAFVAGLLLSPALIATTARLHAGSRPSASDAYGKALGAALSIFVGSIVQGIVLSLLFLAIMVVGVVLAVVLQNEPGLVALAILLGVVVGIVAVVSVAIRWSVWSVAVVLEGRGPLDALSRSWRLVKGNMWRSLGILLVTGLVAAVAGAVLGAVGTALGAAISPRAGRLVSDLLGILTVSWLPIVLTLLFLDLRAREGAALPAAPPIAAPPPEAAWPMTPSTAGSEPPTPPPAGSEPAPPAPPAGEEPPPPSS